MDEGISPAGAERVPGVRDGSASVSYLLSENLTAAGNCCGRCLRVCGWLNRQPGGCGGLTIRAIKVPNILRDTAKHGPVTGIRTPAPEAHIWGIGTVFK